MFRFLAIAITLTTLFLLNHSSPAAAADFRQWCQRTNHIGVCISTIQSDPRPNLKTNPNGFCRILADKGIAVGSTTAVRIDDLLKKSIGAATGALQECSKAYENSLVHLKRVDFNVMNPYTYFDQLSDMRIVVGKPNECDDAFAEFNITSPIAVENSNYRDITRTVKEILNLNECNSVEKM